jgi:hypothetical protein
MKSKKSNFSLLKSTLASLVLLSSQSGAFAEEGSAVDPMNKDSKETAEKASCKGHHGCCGEKAKKDGTCPHAECAGKDKESCPHAMAGDKDKMACSGKGGCGGANGCGGKKGMAKGSAVKKTKNKAKAEVAPEPVVESEKK